MKTYKEVVEILERHIDAEMKNPEEALTKDIGYAMDMWNTSMIRADEQEERISLHEKEKGYKKMLDYAEILFEPALHTPNQYGAHRGMYIFHIYTTMRGNLEEIQNAKKG